MIHNWHPVKLAIAWVIDLAILLVLWLSVSPSSGADQALVIFVCLILSVPLFVITWKWCSGREPFGSGRNTTNPSAFSPTFKIELSLPEGERVYSTNDRPIKRVRKEYRICKLSVLKSLLEEGFVAHLNQAQRKDFLKSYEFTEKHTEYRSIQQFEKEIEGWDLLSLIPIETESDEKEVTILALMQRSIETETDSMEGG